MAAKPVAAVAVLATALVAGGRSAEKASIEQQIRQMETKRLTFAEDSSRWADDVADDALFMQGTGVMLSKQQTIDNYRNYEITNSTEMTETEFRRSGDTAIFSYVATRIRHDDKDRAIRHQHLRKTVVYQRRDGKWRLILLSAAVVPYADGAQRPVVPKILDEYVGVYEDFPPPSTVTFSREGAHLLAQGSSEKDRTELLALSDDTFAVRGATSQFYFERGSDGHFIQLWYRDNGGDQLIQKRQKK